MLKIGEFSKLAKVSIKMLRHYDEIGLFKPVMTDSFTGYRYYREDQLITMGRICSLKEMGFSLSVIASITSEPMNKERLDAFLETQFHELKSARDTVARQMMLLESARKRLREEQTMKYDVTVKTIPERYAATVRMTIPHYEDEGIAWNVLSDETEALRLNLADPCLTGATYLDDEYKEENVDLIVWKTVSSGYPDTEHVRFQTLPAVKVAACVINGSYEQMNEVYAAVISWVQENGYVCDGAMFNIYHVSPHETQNPDEYVTEVCYPIKEKA